MKPTMRKGGRMMFDLNIKFVVGLHEVTDGNESSSIR